MPWIEHSPPPAEQPARWNMCGVATAHEFTDAEYRYAVKKRAELTALREKLLRDKSDLEKIKDFTTCKYIGQLCAEILKEQRGWDLCVKWIEGDPDVYSWRSSRVQKEIAPYLDAAFTEIMCV